MIILKRSFFFGLLIALFYILGPIQATKAEESKAEIRYTWFNEVFCKEHNPGSVTDVILRSFEQAMALCPPKESYKAVKKMYKKIREVAICSEINLPEQASGTECLSHKGGLFMLYENPETNERAIVDLSDEGKIWYDYLPVQRRYHKALEKCEEQEKRLPTKEEFKKAEENGIREAFYGLLDGENLWALDGPKNKRYAYVFDGSEGNIKFNSYGYKSLYLPALCVSDKN